MRGLTQLIKHLLQPRLKRLDTVERVLGGARFTVADVGSTGGMDAKWSPLQPIANVYAFDPDSRATAGDQQVTVLPFGLWSCEATLPLHLTRFPPASSVFPHNQALLGDFLNADCHRVVARKEIAVRTMASALKGMAAPDFIKVDAEGADLAILEGAQEFVQSICVGIQAEVQFVERNLASPTFARIDEFLQSRGYMLLTLQREFWIRNNKAWGITSQAQLIWADAVYLLSVERALARAVELGPADRHRLLAKLVAASAVYGAHDYAMDAIRRFREHGFAEVGVADALSGFIRANVSSTGVELLRRFLHLVLAFVILLGAVFVSSQRKRAVQFARLSAARFFHSLYLSCARTGENRVAISDGAV